MKKLRLLFLSLPWLLSSFAFGQSDETAATKLGTFDLDFPGGTPGELAAAIQKATGRPLNTIIPADEAQTPLPALKLSGVNVQQLFMALFTANTRQRGIVTNHATGAKSYTNVSYGFVALGYKGPASLSNATADTIWCFRDERTAFPTECRFFQLAQYLANGVTVDDITTAIETGWKMLGYENPPKLNFHKETSLLIAVGDPDQLELISGVLSQLTQAKPAR